MFCINITSMKMQKTHFAPSKSHAWSHTHTHTHIYTYTHTHTNKQTYTYINIYIHTCIHSCINTHTYIHIHISIQPSMHIHIHTHVYLFFDYFYLFIENVATNKPAYQSSFYDTSVLPGKAVDGDITQQPGGYCILTNTNQPFTWWEVNLGHQYFIHEVIIYFRTDCE